MKKILTFCLLGLVTISLSAQESSPGMGSASLEQYVSKTINSNPEIQASWRQLQIAMKDVDIAKSGYLPSVDVLASSAYTERNYGLDQDYAGHTAEIRLTQLLYDGFFYLQ